MLRWVEMENGFDACYQLFSAFLILMHNQLLIDFYNVCSCKYRKGNWEVEVEKRFEICGHIQCIEIPQKGSYV